MSDLNIRRLRYFSIVAEELHFGRAAERLHIAQPVLSRQIAVLESELGVELFERSTRGTQLTDAGRSLRDDAKTLLRSATALQRRARVSARGMQRFVIGFMPGLIATPIVRELAERFPNLDVSVVRTSWDDQVEMLHDGRVDVSLVRLPIDKRGLTLLPLFDEARLVALPVSHPLAGHASVTVADLAPLPLLQSPDAVPEWRDAQLDFVPIEGGITRERTPVYTVEEKLEHVAAGRGIAVLPASTARFYSRPDVIYLPVTDLPPGSVALAWESRRSSPPIEAAAEASTRYWK
jgi:DNA-binding transcriptional LysR family regulator